MTAGEERMALSVLLFLDTGQGNFVRHRLRFAILLSLLEGNVHDDLKRARRRRDATRFKNRIFRRDLFEEMILRGFGGGYGFFFCLPVVLLRGSGVRCG